MRERVQTAVEKLPVFNWFLPLGNWLDSPMFFIVPLLAFAMAFFAVDWINAFFETRAGFEWWLIAGVLLFGLAAFWINLSFYFGEAAALNSSDQGVVKLSWCFNTNSECDKFFAQVNQQPATETRANGSSVSVRYLPVNYFNHFRDSAFSLMLLGFFMGWLARLSAAVAGERFA